MSSRSKVPAAIRIAPTRAGIYSPHFQAYNRNKRSVVCDLKQPADRELFERLIARSRRLHPELPPRHGGEARRRRRRDCSELNPRLVYCSISGFGASGPYAERPSYDSVAQALSRIPERGGRSGPAALPRPGAGRCHHRHLRGATACSARCSNAAAPAAASWSKCRCSRPWRISPSSLSRRSSRSGTVPKSTRSPAPRAGLHPAHRGRQADRHPPVVAGEVLARTGRGAASAEELDAATRASARAWRASTTTRRWAPSSIAVSRSRPLAEWAQRLSAHDVPFAPINGIDAVVKDPQVAAPRPDRAGRGAQQGGREAVRPPLQFDGERATLVTAAPLLDRARRRRSAPRSLSKHSAGPRVTAAAHAGASERMRVRCKLFPTTLVGSLSAAGLADRPRRSSRAAFRRACARGSCGASRSPTSRRRRTTPRCSPSARRKKPASTSSPTARSAARAIRTDSPPRSKASTSTIPGTALDRSGHPNPVPRVVGTDPPQACRCRSMTWSS